jgi:hypothetical protein
MAAAGAHDPRDPPSAGPRPAGIGAVGTVEAASLPLKPFALGLAGVLLLLALLLLVATNGAFRLTRLSRPLGIVTAAVFCSIVVGLLAAQLAG